MLGNRFFLTHGLRIHAAMRLRGYFLGMIGGPTDDRLDQAALAFDLTGRNRFSGIRQSIGTAGRLGRIALHDAARLLGLARLDLGLFFSHLVGNRCKLACGNPANLGTRINSILPKETEDYFVWHALLLGPKVYADLFVIIAHAFLRSNSPAIKPAPRSRFVLPHFRKNLHQWARRPYGTERPDSKSVHAHPWCHGVRLR
jgi:hypothetical protein